MAANCISLLQEICQKNRKDLPTYTDVEAGAPSSIKKCVCQLYEWTTEGSGVSKRCARQNSAQLMLQIVQKDSEFMASTTKQERNVLLDPVATKVNLYASKNKKELPLFIDKQCKADSFIVECKFDGYSAVGKGSNKKAAKENALEQIAKHFKINQFYKNYYKNQEMQVKTVPLKNAVTQLLELCQARKISASFAEETVNNIAHGKTPHYVVTCSVNDLRTQSVPCFSKKFAKLEASELMLSKLKHTTHFNTPAQSPSTNTTLCNMSTQSLLNKNKLFSTPVQSMFKLPKRKAKMSSLKDVKPSDEDQYGSEDDCDPDLPEPDEPSEEEQDGVFEDDEHCVSASDNGSFHEEGECFDDDSENETLNRLLPEANLSDDDAPIAKRSRTK